MRTKNAGISADSATTVAPIRPVEIGRHRRLAGGGFAIDVDGAIGYQLRLVPSNKVLGRYASTSGAWPAIVAAIDGGRTARTVVLDWQAADGASGRVAGGVTLEYLARTGLGLPAEHLRRLGS